MEETLKSELRRAVQKRIPHAFVSIAPMGDLHTYRFSIESRLATQLFVDEKEVTGDCNSIPMIASQMIDTHERAYAASDNRMNDLLLDLKQCLDAMARDFPDKHDPVLAYRLQCMLKTHQPRTAT